jgi:3',5'-cyclic AMP phosphodiesterase CpdA
MSRVLLHVSDLHFGRVPPGMPEHLLQAAREIRPDVLVVSGDLTQRARTEEFREASAFLDQFDTPRIVIPGNHDVPLYNLYGRFVERLDRFREYITDDLTPEYVDGEIAVFGVNTARSLTWKNGRINPRQVEELHSRLCTLAPGVLRVVVTHHPMDLPEGFHARNLVGSARSAFERWAACGADLLLCGHLHVGNITTTVERYGPSLWHAIVINAGTAISSRGRGAANSFNVIVTEGRSSVSVTKWLWDVGARRFVKTPEAHYKRAVAGWRKQLVPAPGQPAL